jgi:hypothetical protein
MRSKPLAKLLLVLAGLLALAAPAATAAETLVLTCEVCTELIVTARDCRRAVAGHSSCCCSRS